MNLQLDNNSSDVFSPISRAIEKKSHLMISEAQDCCRIFHGRGKCFSPFDWLNVDYFTSLILITIYRLPDDVEISTMVTSVIDTLKNEKIIGTDNAFVEAVLIQRRDLSNAPFEAVYGEVPETCYALRQELRFALSFTQQNLGYFLDIEPARVWLQLNVKDKKVLNLFAYTCAFSVVAKAAEAASIVNIDLSRKSLDRGRENHRINNLGNDSVHYFAHDIFKSWGKLKKYGPYDIVIIDPPSFQKGSFVAKKDYVKVLAKMSALVAENGCFLACLNAPEIIADEFKAWIDSICDEFSYCETLSHHSDFPEKEQGRELKMLVYKKT